MVGFLIREKHIAVGQGDFSGRGSVAAAYQYGIRDGMVRDKEVVALDNCIIIIQIQ